MAGKASVEAVRARNRALVLEALRRAPVPLSRTEIAQMTGLSSASLSSLAADMLGEGLLAPADAAAGGGRGRPQAPLRLNGARAATLALFVAADGVRLHLSDYAGGQLAEALAPPVPAGVDAAGLVAALIERIARFLGDAPRHPPLAAVALAFQGVIDSGGQRLVWSPIVAPRGAALSAPLAEALGVPVVALNDCSAMVEALLWTNGAPGPDFAVILLGSGVGMGLALNGAVFEGTGLSALEFGHTTHMPGGRRCRCGRRGCIEAYVADYALERAAEAPGLGCIGIARRAATGDPGAMAALAEAGMALGYGVARVFALFGPLPLVLAGPGVACFPPMEAAFRVALTDGLAAELSAPPAITLIERADSLALTGAAHHALSRLDSAFANRTMLAMETTA